jgi:hypothetical protein
MTKALKKLVEGGCYELTEHFGTRSSSFRPGRKLVAVKPIRDGFWEIKMGSCQYRVHEQEILPCLKIAEQPDNPLRKITDRIRMAAPENSPTKENFHRFTAKQVWAVFASDTEASFLFVTADDERVSIQMDAELVRSFGKNRNAYLRKQQRKGR